ncbi:tRNA-guanine transglycosylase [Paenibacillus humicus]|uniref:tRNA-guanine transglycosylase n=1 Tax=Paenibacillus humicus TaxID=412861 RepID=UPI003D290474
MNFDRVFNTKSGKKVNLPIFIPVYRPGFSINTLGAWDGKPEIEACMVNAFLLYKDANKKRLFEEGLKLSEYVGSFNGLLCTDSGAFQGFKGPVYLSNKTIVKFQDMIRTDIAAPLDLITPPGDNKEISERKLISTQKRTKEAFELVEYSMLAGIQQGGRFFDLRQRSIRELADMGIQYFGIGSLVPFFNKNHDMRFVGKVIKDARLAIGREYPMHIYGAGDPLEIPFMVYLGANIFDSSSYAHYARKGLYMTPFGAISNLSLLDNIGYKCNCPKCSTVGPDAVLLSEEDLSIHNLWIICRTIEEIRDALDNDTLEDMLIDILNKHQIINPSTLLLDSWNQLVG